MIKFLKKAAAIICAIGLVVLAKAPMVGAIICAVGVITLPFLMLLEKKDKDLDE